MLKINSKCYNHNSVPQIGLIPTLTDKYHIKDFLGQYKCYRSHLKIDCFSLVRSQERSPLQSHSLEERQRRRETRPCHRLPPNRAVALASLRRERNFIYMLEHGFKVLQEFHSETETCKILCYYLIGV